jgi:hypothetical protein
LVLVKILHISREPLEPLWGGPYPVLLSTPTGVQVAGLESWIHISRVKHWNPQKTALQNLDSNEPQYS